MKSLIEDFMLVAPVDEDRMQRPVKIAAAGYADDENGLHRIENFPRTHRQAGGAQDAAEMHDVGYKFTALELVQQREARRGGAVSGLSHSLTTVAPRDRP